MRQVSAVPIAGIPLSTSMHLSKGIPLKGDPFIPQGIHQLLNLYANEGKENGYFIYVRACHHLFASIFLHFLVPAIMRLT